MSASIVRVYEEEGEMKKRQKKRMLWIWLDSLICQIVAIIFWAVTFVGFSYVRMSCLITAIIFGNVDIIAFKCSSGKQFAAFIKKCWWLELQYKISFAHLQMVRATPPHPTQQYIFLRSFHFPPWTVFEPTPSQKQRPTAADRQTSYINVLITFTHTEWSLHRMNF